MHMSMTRQRSAAYSINVVKLIKLYIVNLNFNIYLCSLAPGNIGRPTMSAA